MRAKVFPDVDDRTRSSSGNGTVVDVNVNGTECRVDEKPPPEEEFAGPELVDTPKELEVGGHDRAMPPSSIERPPPLRAPSEASGVGARTVRRA